jgi:hypothetical protein
MRNSMRKAVTFISLGVLIAANPALAHHPFSSEFDVNAPLSLSGQVTQIEWNEPHVIVHMGVNDPSGQKRTWSFEAASPRMLEGKGWTRTTLKDGDQITVQGYRAKSEPFVAAARMIELPGGKKLLAADDDDGGPKL